MKHYPATVQCLCGHRFAVCVHSPRVAVSGKEFIVMCPMNGSKVSLSARVLMSVESCPAGAVIVRDDRG